jgi:hypothetical protein
VHREFEDYLKFSRLENGFLRMRYASCHAEHLVRKGVYTHHMAKTGAELIYLAHAIANRVGRFLEWQVLLEGDAENILGRNSPDLAS